jgi:hypothetical protein
MTVMKIRALRRTRGRNRKNKENYKIMSFTTLVRLAGIRKFKFGRVKFIRHVARISGKRNAHKIWV